MRVQSGISLLTTVGVRMIRLGRLSLPRDKPKLFLCTKISHLLFGNLLKVLKCIVFLSLQNSAILDIIKAKFSVVEHDSILNFPRDRRFTLPLFLLEDADLSRQA